MAAKRVIGSPANELDELPRPERPGVSFDRGDDLPYAPWPEIRIVGVVKRVEDGCLAARMSSAHRS